MLFKRLLFQANKQTEASQSLEFDLLDLQSLIDAETERIERINLLKQKDKVFAKRIEQFEIFKKIKKAPIFDEEKSAGELNVPKTLKDRDKRELLNILEVHRNTRINPYTPIQARLQHDVVDFCKKTFQF